MMKFLSLLTVLLAVCLSSSGAMAEVRSAAVAYKDGHDGVRHGFTNPDAGSFGIDNLKYDEAADVASRRSLLQTFNTVF